MNNKESYKQLLKDPRWIKKRNGVLSRDGNMCQFCGSQSRYLRYPNMIEKYDKTK